MLIGERVYRLYIQIDKKRNLALKYIRHCCFFGENYYSNIETVVINGDVCSRMGPLYASNCLILDDGRTLIYWLRNSQKFPIPQ